MQELPGIGYTWDDGIHGMSVLGCARSTMSLPVQSRSRSLLQEPGWWAGLLFERIDTMGSFWLWEKNSFQNIMIIMSCFGGLSLASDALKMQDLKCVNS